MNKVEAIKIWDKYYKRKKLEKDEEKEYLDALTYLYKEEKDSDAAYALGRYYANCEKYKEAQKYYQAAIKLNNANAYRDLGYLYYNGKINGERDYINAAKYFDTASSKGSIDASIKLAEMYQKGQGVVQNNSVGFEILQNAKKNAIAQEKDMHFYLPEINVLLVNFYAQNNDISSIVSCLLSARESLIERLIINQEKEDLLLMETVVNGIYKYSKIKDDECIYNLFNLLKEDGKYKFKYNKDKYVIHVSHNDNLLVIDLDGTYFNSPLEFFEDAKINDVNIYLLAKDCKLL